MEDTHVGKAVELLEKANAELEPELLSIPEARARLETYVRAERLAAFGVAALARKVDDAPGLARVTGTSVGKAKETIATSEILGESGPLNEALKHGAISLDQATEIARAEGSAPGAATELLAVAQEEPFHVLKERACKVKLEAEQHRDLAVRQHAARGARSYSDELGMVHVHLALEPHVGTPIVARAEAEAARLALSARRNATQDPFECHLADAYANAFCGAGKGRAKRPELVVLVSHEVTQRGWTDVRQGEVCKIPGVGPVSPEVAKEIAQDAFLNGVFYDGKDLRGFARWTRSIPIEVAIALELGDPPSFDGVACVDCGNRFRTEFDHIEPRAARGPTSNPNLNPRCWKCHKAKTQRDRRAGKLKPAEP
ncbi:MAG: HNH endonuclease signature motif containing protein [Actinomycetota bacterium]